MKIGLKGIKKKLLSVSENCASPVKNSPVCMHEFMQLNKNLTQTSARI